MTNRAFSRGITAAMLIPKQKIGVPLGNRTNMAAGHVCVKRTLYGHPTMKVKEGL